MSTPPAGDRIPARLGALATACENRSGLARVRALRIADELEELDETALATQLRNATQWSLDNLAAGCRNVAAALRHAREEAAR